MKSFMVTVVLELAMESSEDSAHGLRNRDLFALSIRREYMLSPNVDIESASPCGTIVD